MRAAIWQLVTPVEPAVRRNLRKEPHRVGAGLAFGVGLVQFGNFTGEPESSV